MARAGLLSNQGMRVSKVRRSEVKGKRGQRGKRASSDANGFCNGFVGAGRQRPFGTKDDGLGRRSRAAIEMRRLERN